MALQFNPGPYLQIYQQQQADNAAQRADQNAAGQNILQGLQMLMNDRRQQQLLNMTQQKNTLDAANAAREADYKYGKPIDPGAMFAEPGGVGKSSFMPGGQGPVAQGSSVIDAFNAFKAGGMKAADARPEFLPALSQEERKQFYEQNKPISPLEEALKRSQIFKNLREPSSNDALKPPPGYRFKSDGSLEAIPGGPAAQKVASAQETADANMRGMRDQADLVINKVDQALSKVGVTTAGIGGSVMSHIPGSSAKDLDADLDTIKAILGFNTLSEMRKASPTGGALGQVSERELKLLTSARASLDQAQSPEQLRDRLTEIKTHYQNWLNAVQQANGGSSAATPAPATGKIRVRNLQTGQSGTISAQYFDPQKYERL